MMRGEFQDSEAALFLRNLLYSKVESIRQIKQILQAKNHSFKIDNKTFMKR